MSRWYRAYAGTITDPKIGGAALRAGVSKSVVAATWHLILESAAEANAAGETNIDEFGIASTLGEPVESISRVLAALAVADMFCDGRVLAWQRRQYESDNSTERTKRWRERNVKPCDGNETSQDRSVTPPDTDTDTEKKEEVVVALQPTRQPKGTRLSEGWKPSSEGMDFALSKLGQLGASQELEKFADYWLSLAGQRAVKLDWNRTWRNWVRNSNAGNYHGSRGSRALQDDSRSVTRAIDDLKTGVENGVITFPPRPSLLPRKGEDDRRLLPPGRSAEP